MPRPGRILVLGVGVALILSAAFFALRQQETYRCTTCHSRKDVSQWRLGPLEGPSLPLWPAHETETRSAILEDLFAGDHQHEWAGAYGHSVGWQGEMWSDGEGAYRNPFCGWYQRDPGFRELVRNKIKAGELSKATVLKIVALPLDADQDERADPITRELAELGNRLVDERLGKK
jgi:hypothetical protein